MSAKTKRQTLPWAFAEFVLIAAWLRDGDSLSSIAWRLERSIPSVRVVAFGIGLAACQPAGPRDQAIDACVRHADGAPARVAECQDRVRPAGGAA